MAVAVSMGRGRTFKGVDSALHGLPVSCLHAVKIMLRLIDLTFIPNRTFAYVVIITHVSGIQHRDVHMRYDRCGFRAGSRRLLGTVCVDDGVSLQRHPLHLSRLQAAAEVSRQDTV